MLVLGLGCLGLGYVLYSDQMRPKWQAGLAIAVGLGLLGGSVYMFVSSRKKTCNPDLWKMRNNVVKPTRLADYSNVASVCDAQITAESDNTVTSFYYDSGSKSMWVTDTDTPRVQLSNASTTVSFYYYKDDTKPTFLSAPSAPSSASASPTTTSSSASASTSGGTTCCFRNPSDACITFEQTYVGTRIPDSVKNLFTNNRAGTGNYIGDFTSQNQSTGATSLVYDFSQVVSSTATSPITVTNVSSVTWSDCSPLYVKNFVPKMISGMLPQNQKIVNIDTALIKAMIDHLVYIARNGSPDQFLPVSGPWRSAMQIKGNYMFDQNAVVKYNDVFYTGPTAITGAMRNILIQE